MLNTETLSELQRASLKAQSGALHLLASELSLAHNKFQEFLAFTEQNCRLPFAWYAIGLMYLKANCLVAARASLKVVLHLDVNFESKDDVAFRLALLSLHFGEFDDARKVSKERFQWVQLYTKSVL